MSLRTTTLLLVLLFGTGCAEGYWQVGFGLPWEDREVAVLDDGCTVTWTTLLWSLDSGTLLGDEDVLATTDDPLTVDLIEVPRVSWHAPGTRAGTTASTVLLVGRPPEEPVPTELDGCWRDDCGTDNAGSDDSWAWGNADAAQREALRATGSAGRVAGRLQCGRRTLAFSWDLPPSELTCALPPETEVPSRRSLTSWVRLDAAAPFTSGEGERLGAPWLRADDGDGVLTDADLEAPAGALGEGTLAEHLAATLEHAVAVDGAECEPTP